MISLSTLEILTTFVVFEGESNYDNDKARDGCSSFQ